MLRAFPVSPLCPLWLKGFRTQLYPNSPLCYNPHRHSFREIHPERLIPTRPIPRTSGRDFLLGLLHPPRVNRQRAFPAASIAVTNRIALSHSSLSAKLPLKRVPHPSFRDLRKEGGDFDLVTPSTLFDLASLTKPVATTTMAAILYERGLLELETPVIGVIPEFLPTPAKNPIPVAATSPSACSWPIPRACPPTRSYSSNAHSREDLLRAAFTTVPLRRSRHPRRIQRHRIHHPRRSPRTHRQKISRRLLPTRNLRPASHDEHDLQSPTERRTARSPPPPTNARKHRKTTVAPAPPPANCRHPQIPRARPAPPPAKSSKAKSRTKTPASWAASPPTPASSPPPKTWRTSPTLYSTAEAPSSVPKPSPSSPAANPRPQALPAPSAGTHPPPRRNRENISARALSVTSVTPAHLCGSIPTANSRSRFSPTAPGPTARIKPSNKSAQISRRSNRSPSLTPRHISGYNDPALSNLFLRDLCARTSSAEFLTAGTFRTANPIPTGEPLDLIPHPQRTIPICSIFAPNRISPRPPISTRSPSLEIVRIINDEDATIATAVRRALPQSPAPST